MSNHEYDSLREEMISRINTTNTLAVSSVTFAVAAWTVGIALLAIPFNGNIEILEKNNISNLFYLIPALFSFASILILLPFSIKSSENIFQSTAISCYLQVFYECKDNKDCGAWETINTGVNIDKLGHGIYQKFSWLFNAEYPFLAVVSFLLYSVSSIVYFKVGGDIIICKILTVIGIVSIILVIIIYFITSRIVFSKKYIEIYIKNYVQKGVDYMMFSKKDYENLQGRFGKIIGDIEYKTSNLLEGKCIIAINNSLIESTSQIMFAIANQARNHGCIFFTATPKYKNENVKKILKPNDAEFHIFIGNYFNGWFQRLLNKYTGYNGTYSYFVTYKFINKIKKLNPDLIHIHNLHDCNLNLGMLFRYTKKRNIPVIWTLHDCWAFTGNCIYYGMAGCEKWKTKCQKCNQPEAYPYRKLDKTEQMYKKKKKWFSNQKLTLVTPSEWLKHEVGYSFLNKYNVKVINNGINLDVFNYNMDDAQQLKNEYLLNNKFVVLGVASLWDRRKGLDIFNNLANDIELSKDFAFVAVGITENDKKNLSNNIIQISPIRGEPSKIAAWYSAADIFLNPTRDDNFPTTNIESLACGTAVITFKTGGSPEMLTEECGIVLNSDRYELLKDTLKQCKEHRFLKSACRSQAEKYKNIDKYQEYLKLYAQIIETQ